MQIKWICAYKYVIYLASKSVSRQSLSKIALKNVSFSPKNVKLVKKKWSKFLNFCFSNVSFLCKNWKSRKSLRNCQKMSNFSWFWSKDCWKIAKIWLKFQNFQKSALKSQFFVIRIENQGNVSKIAQKMNFWLWKM